PGGRACLAGRQTLTCTTKRLLHGGTCSSLCFAGLYLAEDGGAVGLQDGGTGADDLTAPPQAGGDAVAPQPAAAFGQEHGGLLAGGVVKIGDLGPGRAVPAGRFQMPALQGRFEGEKLDGVGAFQLAVPQPGEAGPQGDQPPVIVHQPVEPRGPATVQLVDGGGRAVAVVDALFGAGKLLPCQHEGGAHAGQIDAGGQPVLGQDDVGGGGVVRLFVFDGQQL